jgi:hypothetical protein
MLRTLVVMIAMPLIGDAIAGGFEAKTMRDSLAAREVERPLVIGKGWLEANLASDIKNATGYWDAEGKAQDFERANWLYTTQRVTIRYGIAKRADFWWSLPTHYARLTNNLLDTDTSKYGMGDPSFGYRHELYRASAPTVSVATKVFYKAPGADDSPGNSTGGPNTFNNIVLGTGTSDLGFGLEAKKQAGPFAVRLGVAYTHRFSGPVSYLIETEFHQFQARIKPGDTVDYDADIMMQIGPVALHNTWFIQQRSETRVGTASPGLFGDANLQPVPDSDGSAVDSSFGVVVNVTRGVDVLFDVRQPLVGEDLQFFPLEQIHPTRGTTYSTALELRY